MASAAIPEKYSYEYEYKYQKKQPDNNHTYTGTDQEKIKDLQFYWHQAPDDKQRDRLLTWQRAKSRKITEEYKAYVEAVSNPILDACIIKLQQSGFTANKSNYIKYNKNGNPSYGHLLRTGKTSKNVKNENAAAKKITPDVLRQVIEAQIGPIDKDDIDILSEALSKKLGMGNSSGGKRKTRKHSKKSRSHRKSSKKTIHKRSTKRRN